MCFPRFLLPVAGWLLVSHAPFIAPATVAWADAGDLLWQDQLHRGIDFGTAVAVQGQRVLAGGFSQNEATGDTDFVRAYDARTGRLVWEHRSAKVANSQDVVLAAAGQLVFAGLGNGIRAHDVHTGAVAWEDALGGAVVTAITAREGLVVVVGSRPTAVPSGGDVDFLVRAYDPATGTLLWDDQLDGGNNDQVRAFAFAVAVDGGRVFVAGETVGAGIDRSFLLRAYASRTGERLWEDSRPGSSTAAFAAIGHAGIVAITGTRNLAVGSNPFVQAHDAETGRLLWQHEGVQDGGVPTAGFAVGLAAQGRQLFAAGSRGGFLVQAHDLRTGALLWQRESPADFGAAMAVTPAGRTVLAAGVDDADWLVQAYDAHTGDLVWEDRFDNAGSIDIARDEETGGGRLFVAGDVQTPAEFSDFLIRAYDAR